MLIKITKEKISNGRLEHVGSAGKQKHIYANVKDAAFALEIKGRRRVYLFGEVFYYIQNSKSIKILDSNCAHYLENIFSSNKLEDVICRLEGQYVGFLVNKKIKSLTVFCDRYARLDLFYSYDGKHFILASDLDFIFKFVRPQYEQKMLAHLFSVYGWYTPKGKTIYSNVKRLKVGEMLHVDCSGVHSEYIEFKPLEIEDYREKELFRYEKLLRESVIARANHNGKNWVSSSSGWDSSIVLGILVDIFGSKHVGMLTGSMKYSAQTGVINRFEINKIKKIGDFYGIKPEIIDFDFKSKSAASYWKRVLPFFKSKHNYTHATYNFTKLSEKLTRVAGSGQTIFNGETSDSFHNFGFSQFTTLFHTQKPFTEYADKMNCYLFGPSFLKKILGGAYERDKVFQIFKKMYSKVEFASAFRNRTDLLESYLFPFFYGSPRVPFAKTYLNPALTKTAQQRLYHFPFREYVPQALSMEEKNVYSWLIYLYHSFHSQGSTVSVHRHSMELNNHYWRSPFNDYRLIEFLSKAPENWGRGLDFNNTKYPLKWVAKNRIKFPYELLDEGSHAYLYDAIEGFSLAAETIYRSGFTEFFKDTLRSKPYKKILSDDYFNARYIDGLVNGYLADKEARGADFNNLVSLITLCITGWY